MRWTRVFAGGEPKKIFRAKNFQDEGLSAPHRRLPAPPPEDIFAEMKDASTDVVSNAPDHQPDRQKHNRRQQGHGQAL